MPDPLNTTHPPFAVDLLDAVLTGIPRQAAA